MSPPFKHQKIKIMFIDERTQTPIYADLGVSVSHGTLRACDLIPKFIDVIRDTAEWAQIMSNPTLGWGDIGVIFDPTPYNDNDERWDSGDIAMFLNEEPLRSRRILLWGKRGRRKRLWLLEK